jgi:hypothetical protein
VADARENAGAGALNSAVVERPEARMTRNRYYTTVVPVAGILYVLALLTIDGHHVSSIGALLLAVVVLVGAFLPAPATVDDTDPNHDRARVRDRERNRTDAG